MGRVNIHDPPAVRRARDPSTDHEPVPRASSNALVSPPGPPGSEASRPRSLRLSPQKVNLLLNLLLELVRTRDTEAPLKRSAASSKAFQLQDSSSRFPVKPSESARAGVRVRVRVWFWGSTVELERSAVEIRIQVRGRASSRAGSGRWYGDKRRRHASSGAPCQLAPHKTVLTLESLES